MKRTPGGILVPGTVEHEATANTGEVEASLANIRPAFTLDMVIQGEAGMLIVEMVDTPEGKQPSFTMTGPATVAFEALPEQQQRSIEQAFERAFQALLADHTRELELERNINRVTGGRTDGT